MDDLEITDYQIIPQKYQCSKKGGLVTYIFKEFTAVDTKLFKPSHKKIWEAQSITIKGKRLGKNINLVNIYRPPRLNNNNETVQDFMNEIDPYLHKQSKAKSHTIYAGDFNLDLLHLHHRVKFQEYLDKFTTLGLFPRITLPTRFSKKRCTLIDQLFVKFNDPLQKYNTAIMVTKLSDHFPCILSFDIKDKPKTYPKFIEIQSMTDKQTDEFCVKVTKTLEEKNSDIEKENDVNIAYNALENILTAQHKLSFPLKKVRFNKYEHKIHPWIDTRILRSVKKRDSMYKKLKKTPHTHPTYEGKKINFNTYNSILKSSIRKMKADYYRTEFAKYASSIKKTWQTISTILNRNKTKDSLPTHFIIEAIEEVINLDGTLTSKTTETKIENKTQIAKHFNEYFANIGKNLADKIKYKGPKDYSTYLNDNILSQFHLTEINETQLEEIILSLNTKHSSGYDKISTFLIKKITKSILRALLSIINKSIINGIFPDNLKKAIVVPIFKGQNLNIHQFNSYRPISLLPAMFKIANEWSKQKSVQTSLKMAYFIAKMEKGS